MNTESSRSYARAVGGHVPHAVMRTSFTVELRAVCSPCVIKRISYVVTRIVDKQESIVRTDERKNVPDAWTDVRTDGLMN